MSINNYGTTYKIHPPSGVILNAFRYSPISPLRNERQLKSYIIYSVYLLYIIHPDDDTHGIGIFTFQCVYE